MQQWLQLLIDIFYPNKCLHCGCQIKDNALLCPSCRQALLAVRFLYPQSYECEHLTGICFFYHYEGGIKKALHKIKFQRKKAFLPRTAEELIQVEALNILRETWNLPSKFLVVPIAGDKERREQRGYDMSEAIFNFWRHEPDCQWCEALERIKPTLPQYGLKRQERRINVKNCFRVQVDVSRKDIFLVDDIFTSGATMEEAAKALKRAGARRIWAVTFAGGA